MPLKNKSSYYIVIEKPPKIKVFILAAFVDRKCVHDASVSGWLIAPVIVFYIISQDIKKINKNRGLHAKSVNFIKVIDLILL